MGTLKYVTDTESAAEFMRWASERKVIAFDTETTGLEVRAPGFHVRLAQFGDAQDAWVFPFQEWRGTINEFFRRFDGTLLVHNAKYDVAAMATEGVKLPWHLIDDTMIAMRVAEPTQPAGLKQAATRHVAPGSALAQGDLHAAMQANKWGWDTVPIDFEPYVRYAAMDVILTSRLYEHPVCQYGISSPVFALEMETLVICSDMADRGMLIDVDYCLTQAQTMRERTGALRGMVKDRWHLDISSNAQLAKWFIENGAPITELTASGAPSVNKAQLAKFMVPGSGVPPHVVELTEAVLEYRRKDKLAGSYFESFVELADSDGFLHADIETLAARTGRMSIRRPGLQTLPKPGDDPLSRVVRQAVVPREANHRLISCDFEQIEMRVIGCLSEDPKLIGAFREADMSPDADFFAEMGKIVYRDPGFTKTDKRRKTIKGVMYGMAYGAGPDKLAVTAGIPVEQARDIRASVMSAFPGLGRAMSQYERMARAEGKIQTIYGRELDVDPDAAYKGLNACIQGSAADMFKQALVRLAHAGFDDYMVVPVHDEIVVSVPEEDAEEARHEIARNMQVNELSVAIPADASAPMMRWGDD